MSFEGFKLLYMFSCVGLGLIILSPTLAVVIKLPSGERFSELWILGPSHMAEDYPFNVSANKLYKVYLGIGNHMGGLEYYRVYVKFRNQTDPLPVTVNGVPSDLEPLLEYRVFLKHSEDWEREIRFSFDFDIEGNICRVSKLVIDGYALDVDKVTGWDEEEGGFHFQLFFELWLYNASVPSFRFDDRFVWIWLNMTSL